MLRRNSDYPYPVTLVPAEAPMPTGPAVSRSNPLDLRKIGRILRRHPRIVVATPLILVALALAFVTVVTPQYTGTATVLIDPRHADVTGANDKSVLPNFGTDDATIESQVLLIQSGAALQRVADTLKLTEDPEFRRPPGILAPIKRLFSKGSAPGGATPNDIVRTDAIEILQKRLKVIRQRATFLVDINVSSSDPAKAAVIANAVASSYLLEQVRSKYDATKIANDWLNRQLGTLRERVSVSDKAVEDFRSANNLIVAQGVTLNDQQLSDLNTRLVEASTATAEAKAKYDQARQLTKQGGDPGSLAEALSSETIARLRTQYAELAKSSAEISNRYGAQHPLVSSVRAQLQDTRRLIGEEMQRILQGRRQAYEVASAREQALRTNLGGLQGTSTESGQAQIRLRELQREAEANRTLYESFLARFKETSAQESLEMPDSRVVTKADTPIRPSFPKTPLIVGLALLLGLGLGGVLALAADFLDQRMKTLDQAEAISGLPGIATVPMIGLRELARMTRRGREELKSYRPKTSRLLPPALQPVLMRYAIEEPTSLFAEAIRAVRLAVQRAAKLNAAKVFVVTSAIENEGKTTLATNLALSFSAVGVRTVLVEGDLRNPELTRSLCPHAGIGLFDVAMDQAPLNRAVLWEQASNLSILPCPLPDDPTVLTEFVFSDGIAAVLGELRKHYEVIIVDASPLVPLVDGRALAELADAIVLAIAWDHTPQNVVARAVELLSPVYDRILGTVLTRVDLQRQRFYDESREATYAGPYLYGVAPAREAAE
jgi:exopolysaccharide transport family protein